MVDDGEGGMIGRFARFVEENGLDDDGVDDEFESGYQECQYVLSTISNFP